MEYATALQLAEIERALLFTDTSDDEAVALSLMAASLQVQSDAAFALKLATSALEEEFADEVFVPEHSTVGGALDGAKTLDVKQQTDFCVACDSPASADIVLRRAPCAHSYCHECMRQIYLRGLQDRKLIPSRCCQKDFPVEWNTEVLTGEEAMRYNNILENGFPTLSENVDPEFISNVTLLGGKICSKCGAGIERIDGCVHMTCTYCNHEFCYTCGGDWAPIRACHCELFDLGVEREGERHEHEFRKRYIRKHHAPLRCEFCFWICNHWYFSCLVCNRTTCGPCAHNRPRHEGIQAA